MAADRFIPSRSEFVVHAPPVYRSFDLAQVLSSRLGDPEAVKVEELAGMPGRLLLVFQSSGSGPAADAKAAWQKLQELLGQDFDVEPVLLDADRQRFYPDGSIEVVFVHTPSPNELRGFAKRHDLGTAEELDYAPGHFSFRPNEPPRTFLPDLLASIRGADSGLVEDAWANTYSAYSRR